MEHYVSLVMEYASALVLAGIIKDICEWLLEEED